MKARYWGGLAILLAGVLTVFSVAHVSVAVADPQLPARTGAVVDVADIIRPNQEQALAARAENLKSASNVELVVVTLPSLQGYSVERWGRALGNRWRVGGSAARGVLLIVAPNDREVRIEVGDGLASALSDSRASSIIDAVIVPQFRSGEMSGGILAGVDAIARAVDGSPPEDGSGWQWPPFSNVNWSSVGLWVIIGVFIVLFVLKIMEDGWELPGDRSRQGTWSTGSDDDDGYYFGSSNSGWSSSSSDSGWSGSSSSGSGSSSGGFSGGGASGRW